MKPYYQSPDGGITLYHGDNLPTLADLPAGSADLVLMDPPYCSGGYLEAQKNTRAQGLRGSTVTKAAFRWFAADNMSTAGLAWLLRSVMIEARRILRPNRAAMFFTDWRMVPHLVPVVESSGLRHRNLLIWDKGSAGLGIGFKPAHEIILEFAAGTVEYQTRTATNVLRYPRVSASRKRHNAEKPTALLGELIRHACPQSGVVLDPFVGVGSTLHAAFVEGRQAIGIEIDERYCEIAALRLEAALDGEPTPIARPRRLKAAA